MENEDGTGAHVAMRAKKPRLKRIFCENLFIIHTVPFLWRAVQQQWTWFPFAGREGCRSGYLNEDDEMGRIASILECLLESAMLDLRCEPRGCPD